MRQSIKPITYQQVSDAVFLGKLPSITYNVYPYSYTFKITNDPLPKDIFDWVPFLSNALITTLPKSPRAFLLSNTLYTFNIIVKHYVQFYINWVKAVREYIPEIIGIPYSKFVSAASIKTPLNTLLYVDQRLNIAQLYWAAYQSAEDKKDMYTLIADTIEILKPWLNMEVWAKMQEEKEGSSTVRVNALYDAQVAAEANMGNAPIDQDDVTMEII